MTINFIHLFSPPLLLLLLLLPTFLAASSHIEHPFTLRQPVPATNVTVEHLDPTLPPPLTGGQPPKCSLLVLTHVFADTAASPPASANYTPPLACPAPWTRVVLELSASSDGIQRDCVAAVWLDGAELLRSSTPFSMGPGAFWRVHKDVTRYTSLLRSGGALLSMMLENSDATLLPGVYTVKVTLHFYRGALLGSTTGHPSVKGLYRQPADLILPISQENGACNIGGFWFRVENESHVPTAPITIPRNTYRAVLEIFSSYHADDESWYANPLRSSYQLQNGHVGAGRANGGYRQLYATIDGRFAGGHIPFAVIYPGSINPYFWSPVAAIGAFDHPTYDLDITPFLGLLLDGQPHEIGLGVKGSNPYWLLTANLHLWVDAWSDSVEGALIEYLAPAHQITRHAEWRSQDGSSEVDAEGLTRFSGWVSSSRGNLTTTVRQKVKFKSQVEVQNRGSVRQVEFINKERTSVGVLRGRQVVGRLQLFVEAPLQVQASSVRAVGGAVFEKARVYHQLQEVLNLNENQVVSTSTLVDRQDAEGSALVRGGEPVWGSGVTKSEYKYRDEGTCYLRTVNTAGGVVKVDTVSPSCSAVAEE